MDRRRLLKLGGSSAVAFAFGSAFWDRAFASTVVGPSPFGPLEAADGNGVRLSPGFTARLLATTGEVVEGTDYVWHGEATSRAGSRCGRAGPWSTRGVHARTSRRMPR